MTNYKQFCTKCAKCGGTTSKHYAKSHGGWCKSCVEPEGRHVNGGEHENALLIDSGYEAYSRERGDYDLPDCA